MGLLVLTTCFSSLADVGTTHDLKRQRQTLLQRLELLQSYPADSASLAAIRQVTTEVIALDGRIFESYAESLDRSDEQQTVSTVNAKLLVLLSLISIALAFIFGVMLLLARNHVKNNTGTGLLSLYKQLGLELMGRISPEKTITTKLLRVNAVVVIGLIIMGLSVLAYLVDSI